MNSIERATVGVLPFLGAGLLAALPLLAVSPGDDPLLASTVHLGAVVVLGIVAALLLADHADGTWFSGTRLTPYWRRMASAAGVVALVTGMVALVTLPTAAAIGFDPSLQFLQLLSAMDIAWAGAAIVIGARRGWGRGVAVAAGLALAVVCVWSIWRYLDTVGFTAAGGWLVDGGEMMRLVIPYDMAAAAAAVVVLAMGTRRQPMEQPRLQS